ncbi:uncharacterized protein LOC128998003 [Macrosteles quadrilineatus]|uniref:uncharacterized protein LOC128998003 n=1 Tax=Macrosteles quadrilineatus TaxID=74068 RepID=UPI0023E24C22|nr:uncharacterized protein LOC128998003 [Macrosteles quadrilineatus]
MMCSVRFSHIVLALGCLTLPYTEAEYYDWNFGGPPKTTQNGLGNYQEPRANSVETDNGIMKTETKTIFGQKYKVSIQRHIFWQTGDCEEKIKISRRDSGQEKSLKRKCFFSYYPIISPRVINVGNILLVNRPEDAFFAFSINSNEIIYQMDGKWKKGKYDKDNTNDIELTWFEVEELKESINWWLTVL